MSVTILLIDDDRFVRNLLPLYLQREGMTVIASADGTTGLHAIAEHHPAVVLLDIDLPDMDGWSVLRYMRTHAAYQPAVIMLTGRDEQSDRLQSRELGVADYIVKPFEAANVVARVKAILAHERSGM